MENTVFEHETVTVTCFLLLSKADLACKANMKPVALPSDHLQIFPFRSHHTPECAYLLLPGIRIRLWGVTCECPHLLQLPEEMSLLT